MLKWKLKGFDVPGLPSGKHDAPDRSEHADLLPDVVALWAITFDVGEFRSLLPVERGGAFSRHSQLHKLVLCLTAVYTFVVRASIPEHTQACMTN